MSEQKLPNMFLRSACPTCGTPRALMNGAYLKAVRKQAGVTLRQLAARLGISAAYLCDIEHNRRNGSAKIRTAYLAFKMGAK